MLLLDIKKRVEVRPDESFPYLAQTRMRVASSLLRPGQAAWGQAWLGLMLEHGSFMQHEIWGMGSELGENRKVHTPSFQPPSCLQRKQMCCLPALDLLLFPSAFSVSPAALLVWLMQMASSSACCTPACTGRNLCSDDSPSNDCLTQRRS